MSVHIIGIIPSRYASTRFPGKPLVDIGGKSMVQRVYDQAKKCPLLKEVIVATDDERIYKTVVAFGGRACMTSLNHPSGTDRCAEVIDQLSLSCDAVINIQGDEPFIDPGQIGLVCSSFAENSTEIATLVRKITNADVLHNPNIPKVVVDRYGFALYFSRQTVPYVRGQALQDWLRLHTFYQHIGIYGYRREVLMQLTKLPASPLEKAESLEQLRWVENGFRIKTAVTDHETLAIDTPEDLQHVLDSLNPKT